MKIRQGFVSNSSSASFIIKRKHVSEKQLYKIINHYEWAEMKARGGHGEYQLVTKWAGEHDKWEIDHNDSRIIGSCFMDNFDMKKYLGLIGIKDKHVKYEGN